MDHENENIDELTQANQLRDETVATERQRLVDLRAAFAENPEFAMKAFEEGWNIEQAKAHHHDVLQKQIAEYKAKQAKIDEQQQNKPAIGANVIISEDSDDEAGADFMTEARELAEKKNISMTAAMKQIARKKPQLHEAFKARSEAMGKEAVYAEV